MSFIQDSNKADSDKEKEGDSSSQISIKDNKKSTSTKVASLNTNKKTTNNSKGKSFGEKGGSYVHLAPENLSSSYLIDVKYDGKKEKAYVKLFNPEQGKVFRWYDTTNHLPYLLTTVSKAEVEKKLANEKEFIGCEVIKKYSLLNEKELTLTKVIATNPLVIGGRDNSYREKISPSFEANIRYHLNYIYDNGLVPGLFYEVKNNKLQRVEPKISNEAKDNLLDIFKGQSHEILQLVEQYLPIFFAPIPKISRCSVDIEVESEKNKFPDPHAAIQKVISIGLTNEERETTVFVLNEEKKHIDQSKISIKVKEFDDEKELLLAVFDEMSKYPIVITFNGDSFDFLYLDNRAKKLEIDEELNPFIRTRSQDVYLSNSIHLDLYRFFRQPAIRIYAFGGVYDRITLDELGKTILGKEKLKLEKDIWDLDLEELIEYNGRDSEITFELTSFNNDQVINLIVMLSRITKMPIDDFTRASISIWIQNWMYFEHRLRNYLIPRREDILQLKGGTSTEAIIKGKKYQGAIVIDPQVGVWWDVHVLDFACFSEDTEILTDSGWFKLSRLKEKKQETKLATVNASSNQIEYLDCDEIYEYDFDGEMYSFKNKNSIDLLVTPNHRMVFNSRTNNRNKTTWKDDIEILDAEELSKRSWFRIPHFGLWSGESENITFDEYSFTPADFLPFLGWFLTDGSLGERSVIIHQSKEANFQNIRDSLEKLNLGFKENEYTKQGRKHRNFQINNADFTRKFKEWLSSERGLIQSGKKFNKRIPRRLLGFNKEHLKLMFDTMLLGDGSWLDGKCYSISSTNEEFANDFQELTLRLGYGCSISKEVRDCIVNGIEYKNHVSYRCFISYTRKNVFNNQHNYIEKEKHTGKVWCVSNTNGTVIVRRNGKPAVSGNSLYPSIIKTRNLSYETLNCNHVECKKNKIPETSHWICEKHVGMSSMLIGFIRDIRVYWFKDRAKDPSLSEEERKLSDVIQSSLKVLLNASYGVFGSDNFALYCPPVAESTAALAREAISKTKKYSEEKLGLQVLYGDTDSIFIHKPTPENIEELEKWSMETFQIELGTDYVFRYCGLSDRKKNYFGITTKGYPIVKGLMGRKKNTPNLAKRPFERALEILTDVQTPEELEETKKKIIRIIQAVNQKISKRNFELEDLAIRVTLSKKIEQYDSWTQPLQAAIQLMLAFPDGEKPTVGTLISFIKTKPFKIQAQSIKLSDKISRSKECSVKPIQLAEKSDVDIPKVKELLKSTLIQLLDAIGISWEESIEGQKSLDSWFG
ncbi:MAG: hypothetical protein GPJ51_00140 [Candidatus Heimdallarchaeota archaeon]|nr:hypothetical protein [Candidatus Heimdallarchaeota archaeon]